jgi:hypothetical protein
MTGWLACVVGAVSFGAVLTGCGGGGTILAGQDTKDSGDTKDGGASEDASCEAGPNSPCEIHDASGDVVSGTTPCVATKDCDSLDSPTAQFVCGYPVGGGCSATGKCVTAGPLCNMVTQVVCACDNQSIGYGECSGYPTGYAGAPVAYQGQCE